MNKTPPDKIDENGIAHFDDKNEPFVEGKPLVERNVVHVLIYNRATDEILCLDWGKFGWKMFIAGGVEDGEDPVLAAKREVAEETGYKNLKFIAELAKTRSTFFAAHKDVNRIANATGLLFELESDDKDEVSEEEKAKHEVVWIKKDAVSDYLNVSNQHYLWDKALPLLG